MTPHRQLLELVPWLANGTLVGEERARVQEHVAQCAQCAEELERCRALAAALVAEAPAAAPHPAQLTRLLRRLDAEEAAPALSSLRRLAAPFAALPRGWRWALSAQLALLLVAVLALFGAATPGDQSPAPALYRTLGDAAAAPANGTRLRVVFAPELQEGEMRQLLLEVRAEVVAGPTPLGVYTLALPAGAGEPLTVVLEHLRRQPGVRFAEPVTAGGGEAR